MRKNSIKLICLTISLAMCTGLAACGGGGTSTAQSSGAPASNTAQDSSDAQSSGDVAVLNFPSIWVGADSKAEVFGKMIEGFNQEFAGKYEVKVEDQTDYDAYRAKLRTLIATGDAPDIFTVQDTDDMVMFSESGKLMDLTDFFETSEIAGRFAEGELEKGLVDGKRFALPYETAIIPVIYNGAMLEDAGVAAAPKTIDELFDACQALTDNGVFATAQMTGANAWSSMLWYTYALAAYGGPDVFDDGLDNPAFVQAAGVLKRMYDHTHSDAIGGDANVPNGHFFNERAAIYTNGTWILGRIKSEGTPDLYDNLIVDLGWSDNGKNGGAIISTVQAYLCIGAQDDPNRVEALQEFLRYITEADRIVELTNSSGALFTVKIDPSLVEDPVLSDIIALNNNADFKISHFQDSMPVSVANAFPSAVESLMIGDVDEEGFVAYLKDQL